MDATSKIKQALDTEFECFDFNQPITLRDWFTTALTKLYDEDEGFSGKRPFGNSGWTSYLAIPFIKVGLIEGDEDGYARNPGEAHAYVFQAIKLLTGGEDLDDA